MGSVAICAHGGRVMKKLPVFIFKSDILRNGKMLMECLWAKTVTYGLGFSLSLIHMRTQLLVSSTDEFWENKQLQEEEKTIRLDGLPNFIIYYGLPAMHTQLQPEPSLRFT
ncbi:hypothetical protein ATANTOWER_007636 [Ataeniobius toweri]|uniref:Uncharacterized protein n=1 Tax=Ataeniobius toweri TaxID=208326 RepID=A0ABU7CDG8_9TELE|nr:hypothetical protein [Ataeniobius toweri]